MPNDYSQMIQAAAQKYGVPAPLLMAQMSVESGGNPAATSPQGAQGLMQVMPANQSAYGVTNPNDPAQSIDAGAHLMADNLKTASGNQNIALAMYHGGGDPANWGPKTHAYVQKVNDAMTQQQAADEFDKLYGGGSSTPSGVTPRAQPSQNQSAIDQSAAEFDKLYGGPAAPAVPAAVTNWSHGNLATSLAQGAHDVLDPGARLLARGMDATGITPAWNSVVDALDLPDALKADTTAQFDQKNAILHQAYDQKYGNTTEGQIGRAGGQAFASVPIVLAGSGLLDAGLGAAGEAVGGTAGNVIKGMGRFATGQSGNTASLGGLLAKGASLATQGALTAPAAGYLLPGAAPANLVGDAGYGALLAPAGGAVGGLLGKGLGVLGSAAGGKIAEGLGSSFENSGASKVWQALTQDGISPGDVTAKMVEMGPHSTLVDAASALLGAKGGGNVRNLAEVAANTPGEGQALANQVFGTRADAQADRITQAVQKATGTPGSVYDDAQALMAQRLKDSQPLYAKAFANQVTPDAKLAQMLANPLMKSGVNAVSGIDRNLADAQGVPFDASQYQIPGSGPVQMRVLDAAKRGLDNKVEAYRDPTSGRLVLDATGRSINDLRSAYVSHLDTLNPDYAAARQAWAGPSQSLDAMNLGQRALTNDPEVTSKIVSNLSPNDRQFFLSGVTKAIQDKISSTPDGGNVARKIFSTPAIRAKIQAAFGNDAAFDEFERTMENEKQFAATAGQVLGGSQTFRRLAGASDQGIQEAISPLLHGDVSGAAKGAAAWATRQPPAQLAAQAKLLFSQDPALVDEMLANGAPGTGANLLSAAKQTTGAGLYPSIETYRHQQ